MFLILVTKITISLCSQNIENSTTDITIEAKGWVAGEGIVEDIVDSKRNSYFTVISFFNGDTSVSTWSRPSS